MKKFLIMISLFANMALFGDWHLQDNFSESHKDWTGEFADYPVGQEEFFELDWGWKDLPQPIDEYSKGMMLTGNNHSDDLLMILKKRVDNLEPNTEYRIDFHVKIANNVPTGQIGVGGSPGESVFFKVGASAKEPLPIEKEGYYRLNLDVGSQSQGGAEALVIGDLANPNVDESDRQYAIKELYNTKEFVAKTDENGSLWIFAGTDSGYESTSRYYLVEVNVNFLNN